VSDESKMTPRLRAESEGVMVTLEYKYKIKYSPIYWTEIQQILLSSTMDDDVLAPYTEMDVSDLKLQL